MLPLTLLLLCIAATASCLPTPAAASGLYIAANFHDNAATVPAFVQQVERLASLTDHALYVTVYESGSTDDTPRLLQQARARFDAVGIGHTITTRGRVVRGGRSRIDFLADARNELLKPLRAMAPERVFDSVVFLNDVLFTAEDIIKLLAIKADVACGTDFIPIGDAHKIYRPLVNETYPIFYDAWVARTLDGLPLRAMPPYVPPKNAVATLKTVATMGLSFPDYTRIANMLELTVTPQPEIAQLQCCWNGVVAVRAAPFYRGLSFRSNIPNECAASECSHFCADMWALNYTRFAMHHGVRVAYEQETWARAKALDLTYVSVPVPFKFAPTRPTAVLCCGEHRIVRLPSYGRRPGEPASAFAYRVWMALHEAPPTDDALEFVSALVGEERRVHTELLRPLLSDEPRSACEMQQPVSLAPAVCLSDGARTVPLVVRQAGTLDARDALAPHTTTWKAVHPDHNYVFVDVDAGQWPGGVPGDVVAAFRNARAAGDATTAAAIAHNALLYYGGGIVARLDTAVLASLSCVLRPDDELVDVYQRASDDDAASRHRLHIATAATARHPVALARLRKAMARAGVARLHRSLRIRCSRATGVVSEAGRSRLAGKLASPCHRPTARHVRGNAVAITCEASSVATEDVRSNAA